MEMMIKTCIAIVCILYIDFSDILSFLVTFDVKIAHKQKFSVVKSRYRKWRS